MTSSSTNSRAVILSLIICVLSPLSIDLYLCTIPSINNEFPGYGEMTLSLFLAACGVGSLVMGPVYDRLGPFNLLMICLGAYIASSLAIFLSDSLQAILSLRVIQGVAVSGAGLSSTAIIKDNSDPRDSAKYYAWLQAAIFCVPSTAPFIGAWLLETTGEWRYSFLALAACGLLTVPFVIIYGRGLNRTPISAGFDVTFFKERSYKLFAPIAIASLALVFVYATITPSILITGRGWTSQMYSWLFALNGMSMFVCAMAYASLTKRMSASKLGLIGLTLQLISAPMIALHTYSLTIFIAGIVLFCGAFTWVIPTATSLALADVKKGTGKAVSVVTCLQSVGGGALGILVSKMPIEQEISLGFMVGLLSLYGFWAYRRFHAINNSNKQAVPDQSPVNG